jgi:rfaE bifunctional protein nucleotidyltransferase chain/domain
VKSSQTKIHSLKSLQKKLGSLSFRRKKIVFTNGCFDLLHAGHVRYLEHAKRLGDVLVVALNSDESVRRLKGPERPLNGLQDRAKVIAALESVDFVTAFEDDTPLHAILCLRPHWIVKGGDWKVSQIVGAREARTWGGRAKSLPFVKGKSTTALIHRARS